MLMNPAPRNARTEMVFQGIVLARCASVRAPAGSYIGERNGELTCGVRQALAVNAKHGGGGGGDEQVQPRPGRHFPPR
jgi:hypothetical protein